MEQTVRIEPYAAVAEHANLVHSIADDEALGGESRIQPVQRGLALLEGVQINPATLYAVDAAHDVGRAPVGLLHAWLIEDSR